MRVVRLCFTLSVLAAANAMPALAAPKPTEIVPLYIATNRPLAMLTIGDSAPMPVVFDTGTTENSLDAALAKRVGLKVVGHFNLVDDASGKSVVVPTAAAPDARLSGVPLDIKVVRLPDSRSGDEVGVFGPYSFGSRYVVVEAGRNRRRLMGQGSGFVPPGPGQAGQVHWGHAGGGQGWRQRGGGEPVERGVADGREHPLLLGRGRPDMA